MSDWKNVQYKDGKMRTSEGGGGGGSSTFAGLDDVNFSNIQNGQVPKYNSATQKWENADESGGTVTDVEVDGVSVVNQQGVAEIETPNADGIEYDNQQSGLSATDVQSAIDELAQGGGGASALADLTDVNLTNIQDGQIIKWDNNTQKFVNANESSGGSGHTYSTTEQRIGTWIDGKPVYEKVLVFTPTSESYTVDLSSLNIAHLIDFSGIVREANGNDVFVSYYTDYRDYVAPYFTISGGILHARYSGAWNGGEWNVILKYTKTTD